MRLFVRFHTVNINNKNIRVHDGADGPEVDENSLFNSPAETYDCLHNHGSQQKKERVKTTSC
jgi:hypothetical protein